MCDFNVVATHSNQSVIKGYTGEQYCRICLAPVQGGCPISPNVPIFPKFPGKKLPAILPPTPVIYCQSYQVFVRLFRKSFQVVGTQFHSFIISTIILCYK
jgi:hypothetical protein